MAAGPGLIAECRKLNGCPTGEAKLTGGYKLPCKYIIHTTGPCIEFLGTDERGRPVFSEEDPKMLAQCYNKTLDIMKSQYPKIQSLALCCISTGIFGYKKETGAEVALKTVRQWLETGDNAKFVKLIVFDIWTNEDLAIYQRLAPSYFPPASTSGTNSTGKDQQSGTSNATASSDSADKKDGSATKAKD